MAAPETSGIAVDRRALRRFACRAAASYAQAAVLAREIESRMLDRLQYVRIAPQRVLDAGCGDADGAKRLAERFPQAQTWALDSAFSLLRAARGEASWLSRLFDRSGPGFICADFGALPLAASSIDLVWSNLALHCAGDPLPALKEMHRVLAVDGLLMFSCYGPDTLQELRSAFAAADRAAHVHAFTDMHDLGDMLGASGFGAPVMDMEVLTLTYADVDALLADLRATGQQNALAARRHALTGKGVFGAMRAAYEKLRRDGRLPATFEIVYGHAWKQQRRVSDDGRAIIRVETSRNKKM